jgi:hypothetical protein
MILIFGNRVLWLIKQDGKDRKKNNFTKNTTFAAEKNGQIFKLFLL